MPVRRDRAHRRRAWCRNPRIDWPRAGERSAYADLPHTAPISCLVVSLEAAEFSLREDTSMFAQNVWEPCASLSRRGLTTLLSFTLQLAGVGMLLVLPLIYPGGPPQLDLMRPTFTPLP